ncbi:hypothetical protein [Paenibacillus aceris]|uniref:Uncharacterized protein n=1 Tax=Paenibacillus aceris TaxID=869555 RepID=A0ABS4IBN6_9BACL|nr:hypothetical protein [Paenibacillus aceris]MBP1967776.1 hypothetical protein [Paenibacillus aceris]NHW38200.1 hypothetical protein [Paenibacillus aceris]
MSKVYTLFKEHHITKTELNIFVQRKGGYLNIVDDFVIEKGDASLWIYYSNQINEDFFQKELMEIRQSFNLLPKLIIQIEPSSLEYELSEKMAQEFCESFLNEYSDTVVEDCHGNLYTPQTIFSLECDNEGI